MAINVQTLHIAHRICEQAIEFARTRLSERDFRRVFINVFKIKSWLTNASAREEISYFQSKRIPLLAVRDDPVVDITATTVRALYEAGIVLPLQRRSGEITTYIIKRTKMGII